MANGMEARGYRSGEKRSAFRQLTWNKRDTCCLAVILLLTILLAVLRTIGISH